jgi:hydroxymethylglutaryl-CoA lyase
MANPKLVRKRVKSVLGLVPRDELTLRFHNTRGLGLVNVMAAFDAGTLGFDASLGGLGGCPFVPGASGNVCTEYLVKSLRGDRPEHRPRSPWPDALSRELPSIVGHPGPGQVAKAGRSCDLHPAPLRITLTD